MDRPASPSSARVPSASSSQSATAVAPSGASTCPASMRDELGAVRGQLGRRLDHQQAGPGLAVPPDLGRRDGRPTAPPGVGPIGRPLGHVSGQDRGGHLSERDPGGRGKPGQLADGLGAGQAKPLHQRAPGHRDDRLAGGRGTDLVELTPLMIDDRDQPAHVVTAIRHDHPPSLPHPPLTVTRVPAPRAGFSSLGAATEVRSAHDNYIRSTIGIDRTTVPDTRRAVSVQLMGALGD